MGRTELTLAQQPGHPSKPPSCSATTPAGESVGSSAAICGRFHGGAGGRADRLPRVYLARRAPPLPARRHDHRRARAPRRNRRHAGCRAQRRVWQCRAVPRRAGRTRHPRRRPEAADTGRYRSPVTTAVTPPAARSTPSTTTELDTIALIPRPDFLEIHIDPTEPLPYDTEHLVLSGLTPTAIDDLADVIGPGSGSDLASVEIRHPRQGGPMTRVIQEGLIPRTSTVRISRRAVETGCPNPSLADEVNTHGGRRMPERYPGSHGSRPTTVSPWSGGAASTGRPTTAVRSRR